MHNDGVSLAFLCVQVDFAKHRIGVVGSTRAEHRVTAPASVWGRDKGLGQGVRARVRVRVRDKRLGQVRARARARARVRS